MQQNKIAEAFKEHADEVAEYIATKQNEYSAPLYHSNDIRDAGFKVGVVDTNLFPAGFNNLEKESHAKIISLFQETLQVMEPKAKRLLLVMEEHTRNIWYLENVRIIWTLLKEAGFEVRVTTNVDLPEPEYSQGHFYLKTVGNEKLEVFSLNQILKDQHEKRIFFDAIILNHDLTSGISKELLSLNLPLIPEVSNGWHCRSKYQHFCHLRGSLRELESLLGIDTWYVYPDTTLVSDIDIHDETSRDELADRVDVMLQGLIKSYRYYKVERDPVVYIKSDFGTYGMGVHVVSSAAEVRQLNRKLRNRLDKGKSSRKIDHFLLQEGIPSIWKHNGYTAEPVYYLVGNQLAGRFLRTNSEKNDFQNLNARGMGFAPYSESPMDHLYLTLCQLAGLATRKEIIDEGCKEDRISN